MKSISCLIALVSITQVLAQDDLYPPSQPKHSYGDDTKAYKNCNTIIYPSSANEMSRIDDAIFNLNLQIEEFDKERGVIRTQFSNSFKDSGSLVYTAFYFRVKNDMVYITGEYYSSALGRDSKEPIYFSGWAVPKLAFKRMEMIALILSDNLKYQKR